MQNHLTPVPVAVISGFLGSGKTTLVNRVLTGNHGLRITVLVNDFGAIDIDSQLLASQSANSISLKNGCICCNLQNDLVAELQGLLDQAGGPPDFMLIESSGVSDPGKIIHALCYPQLRERFQINTVLTLLNAATINDLEGEFKHLAMAQLDAADIVVINQIDCVDEQQLEQIHEQWLYPAARVLSTSFADIPIALLFAMHEHDAYETPFQPLTRDHGGLFYSYSWTSDKTLQLDALRQFVKTLPNSIFRAKGVFYTEQLAGQRVVLQAVGTRQEWGKDSQISRERRSDLVMIAMQPIDEPAMQQALDACLV